MSEEWRQISSFPGIDIRRLYVNGEATDVFMVNGRLGYLTAEWWDSTTTPSNVTRQLHVEGMPCLVYQFDGRAMPGIAGGDTVDKQVGASGNDGRRYNASFDTNAQNMQIGQQAGVVYHLFACWTGCTWEGTIESNSYMECYANVNGFAGVQMDVYFVDESNPPAPTSAAEFDADPLTTSYVAWDTPWTGGTWEQSPSLQSPLQEITDSHTIDDANVMAQIRDGGSANNKFNAARAYPHVAGTEYAPKLHVEYTADAAETAAIAGRGWGWSGG